MSIQSMSSILTSIFLISLFVVLLLFVWRQRERTLKSYSKNSGAIDDPWVRPLFVHSNRAEPTDFERMEKDEMDAQFRELKHKEECKDADPLVRFYSKAYKNRWTQVKPDINAVGFTPIAKRCAYPGAPCEWQQ